MRSVKNIVCRPPLACGTPLARSQCCPRVLSWYKCHMWHVPSWPYKQGMEYMPCIAPALASLGPLMHAETALASPKMPHTVPTSAGLEPTLHSATTLAGSETPLHQHLVQAVQGMHCTWCRAWTGQHECCVSWLWHAGSCGKCVCLCVGRKSMGLILPMD